MVGSEVVGAEVVHSISLLSYFFVGSIILDEKAVKSILIRFCFYQSL